MLRMDRFNYHAPLIQLAVILILNLTCTIMFGIPILILNFWTTPFQRGFFCNDESLAHPYHESTISSMLLYIIGFLTNVIAIISVELYFYFKARKHGCNGPPFILDESNRQSMSARVAVTVRIAFLLVGFAFGMAVCQCLTDAAKYSIGRLRPHFFDVCNLDNATVNCGDLMHPKYVTDYTCRGNNILFPDKDVRDYRVKDSHISFVSGHSSFAFQSMVFAILYLQVRFQSIRYPFVIGLIQGIMLTFAIMTTLSRIWDNKHHPTDVIAGAILGIVIQTLNVIFVMKLFRRDNGG